MKFFLIIFTALIFFITTPLQAQSNFDDDYDARKSIYDYYQSERDKRSARSSYDDDDSSYSFGKYKTDPDDKYKDLFSGKKKDDLSYEHQKQNKSSEQVLRDLFKKR